MQAILNASANQEEFIKDLFVSLGRVTVNLNKLIILQVTIDIYNIRKDFKYSSLENCINQRINKNISNTTVFNIIFN